MIILGRNFTYSVCVCLMTKIKTLNARAIAEAIFNDQSGIGRRKVTLTMTIRHARIGGKMRQRVSDAPGIMKPESNGIPLFFLLLLRLLLLLLLVVVAMEKPKVLAGIIDRTPHQIVFLFFTSIERNTKKVLLCQPYKPGAAIVSNKTVNDEIDNPSCWIRPRYHQLKCSRIR